MRGFSSLVALKAELEKRKKEEPKLQTKKKAKPAKKSEKESSTFFDVQESTIRDYIKDNAPDFIEEEKKPTKKQIVQEQQSKLIEKAAISFKANDWDTAKDKLTELAEMDTLSANDRENVVMLAQILQSVLLHLKDNDGVIEPSFKEEAHEKWDTVISNFITSRLPSIETIHDTLTREFQPTELPTTVNRVTVIEDAQVVCSFVSGVSKLPKDSVVNLTNGVYLVFTTIVGVPSESDFVKSYERANKYSVTKLGIELVPHAFTRPDCDGVWFAAMSIPVVVDYVQFPEMMQQKYNYSANFQERNEQKLIQIASLKAKRESWENENRSSIDRQSELIARLKVNRSLAIDLTDTFKTKYQFKWNDVPAVTSHITSLEAYLHTSLKEIQSVDEAVKVTKSIKAKIDEVKRDSKEIADLRVKIKQDSDELKEITEELNDLKVKQRNPQIWEIKHSLDGIKDSL